LNVLVIGDVKFVSELKQIVTECGGYAPLFMVPQQAGRDGEQSARFV